ncbi:MAG: homoserine kinase, partial [Chloroflexota bacterium]
TYSTFDLVCLVEGWGWHYPDKELNLTEAAKVVNHYCQHRSLIPLEEHHFFDVYKLSILIDCLWVFARGSGEEFYERQKIEFMNNLGRDQFKDAIFNP